MDSHNIVCSWCAQAHVSIHSCDFTNGYFQGQEIDRILVYRIPAEGVPEEGSAGGEILASRVSVYGTKDAGRGLWLRLKKTCRQFKFSLNQILPTLFTLRDDESGIIAVMSSNVDDLLAISRRELEPRTLCCNNSWLVKKNTVLSGFAEKSSDKMKTSEFASQPKTTLSKYNNHI